MYKGAGRGAASRIFFAVSAIIACNLVLFHSGQRPERRLQRLRRRLRLVTVCATFMNTLKRIIAI